MKTKTKKTDVVTIISSIIIYVSTSHAHLLQNKKTYLYLKAIEFASQTQKEQLLHLFSIHPNDNVEKIASVKEIFNTTGASKATQQAILDYTLKAFDTLQKIQIDNEKKDMLHSFGENLMGRKV